MAKNKDSKVESEVTETVEAPLYPCSGDHDPFCHNPKACAPVCPWCEATNRLDHKEVRSVRIHGGMLYATVLNDHVEVNLGAYGE